MTSARRAADSQRNDSRLSGPSPHDRRRATQSASAWPREFDELVRRACEVLRRAATGDTLQGDESQLLTQLQLAFRANLEKKHRAATTILRAAERRRLGAVAEQ